MYSSDIWLTMTPFQYLGLTLGGLLLLQALFYLHASWKHQHAEKVLFDQKMKLFEAQAKNLYEQADFEKKHQHLSWNGVRKFVVDEIIEETQDIKSFYLRPHDGKALPPFKPGQYLTFSLHVKESHNNSEKPVVRCYSLSCAPTNVERFRVSIKAIPATQDNPKGLVSNWLHQQLSQGDILDCKAPSGHFFYELSHPRPSILIAGGIGITPILSMFKAIATLPNPPETWLFYGVRQIEDAALLQEIEEIAQQHENLQVRLLISSAKEDLSETQLAGRLSVSKIIEMVGSTNYHFYICGPSPMMSQINQELKELKVPTSDIHYEAFGPATVKSSNSTQNANPTSETNQRLINIGFVRSKKTISWQPSNETLLEIAENSNITMESGCRAGNCGACATAIIEGDVEYFSTPGADQEEGVCLPCICKPSSHLVIDA